MTRPQKIQAIREKCIEANPGILGDEACDTCRESGKPKGGCLERGRPIRLADVLLAMRIKAGIRSGTIASRKDWFINFVETLLELYDLRADSLDQQSEECLAFSL